MTPDHVASPCTKVCTLDPGHRLCLGCGRTVAEIAAWAGASNDQRRAILSAVAERQSVSVTSI